MQVPHGEGVANHIDPESCATIREDRREALTGECTGQAIEPRKTLTEGRYDAERTMRRFEEANTSVQAAAALGGGLRARTT